MPSTPCNITLETATADALRSADRPALVGYIRHLEAKAEALCSRDARTLEELISARAERTALREERDTLHAELVRARREIARLNGEIDQARARGAELAAKVLAGTKDDHGVCFGTCCLVNPGRAF